MAQAAPPETGIHGLFNIFRNNVFAVTPDVTCVQLSIVNVYLVGAPGAGDRGWVLIDAGLFASSSRIIHAAAERFGQESRPAAIILTHGHFDHVGSVEELAELWDAPVYAHPLEMPYLTGRSAYPPPDPTVGGGAIAFMSRLFPQGPIDLGSRVQPLPVDQSVPGLPGWRWLHTPGHSPGHVSLFHDSDRTLIAGDAFVTVRQESALAVLLQKQEVHGPPAYFTPDWQAAHRSVQLLAALEPAVAATGHGVPMSGRPLRTELDNLARDFDHVAVPPHGRYVHQPAVADEGGVVSVPPPIPDPMPRVLAGIGLTTAALVGATLAEQAIKRSRRQGT